MKVNASILSVPGIVIINLADNPNPTFSLKNNHFTSNHRPVRPAHRGGRLPEGHLLHTILTLNIFF
jgi:hypothetical protein